MTSISVFLSDEDADSLKSYVYSIISEEIQKARKDSALDKPIVTQLEIARYLGVSPTTVREFEKLSLPYGSIGKRKFYDKEQCRKWVLSQKID